MDDLYTKTIMGFDPEERTRFRDLVRAFVQDIGRDINLRNFENEYDAIWAKAVVKAIEVSKTWIPHKVRKEILAKMNAAAEEYDEALQAQDAMTAEDSS
jgi:hypothetical protein